MTSIHDPRVGHGTDESVRDPAELDTNEQYLKETKAADETMKAVCILSFHKLEVGDKNLELETLASIKKKDDIEIMETDEDIMPDADRSTPSTTLQVYHIPPRDKTITNLMSPIKIIEPSELTKKKYKRRQVENVK
ncbi:hypothetical protein PanWU01x14_118400 [Parasponia andersonii]|uniref:Uncharacterized protein n=1 Tax=Parasponia andersonii TaxID=3476 RepID=A0A2P5CVP2_PARAD|nr:hypothetical protein PanWU01x14_118400 [Parasponia andersonii]